MTRRKPSEYDWSKAQFDETILHKHFTPHSGKRDVRFIVIHHMVIPDRDPHSDDALDTCYDVWQTRQASAHYGVDGKFVRQYVWDDDEAWATGSNEGNDYGISIEHANLTLDVSGSDRDYLIDEETLATSARLVATLHKVKNLGRPSSKTVRKHSDFFATSCPGPHFDRIWSTYIAACQAAYDGRSGGAQDVEWETPAPKPPGGGFKPLWKPTGKMSVRQIQKAVGVKADGLYGHDTKAAVARYQAKLGVAADGLWGKATEAAHKRKGKVKRAAGSLLRRSSKGARVRRLQRGLNNAFPLYSKLSVDGIYGRATERVVREFQRRSGLAMDGVVGPRTRRELRKHGVRA